MSKPAASSSARSASDSPDRSSGPVKRRIVDLAPGANTGRAGALGFPTAQRIDRKAELQGEIKTADPADEERAGFVLRVWHRSELWHGGLPVLAPRRVVSVGGCRDHWAQSPRGGGEAETGGKDRTFVPPLVSLGLVMLAGESGAGRPNSAGGRNSRQGCEHLRTGGFAGICPHWHAKRGWHRAEHPCHPLNSLKIGNSGAAFGSESPCLGPDLGQKGHATGKSFPCRATPQRQILNKTRGGTKGATFPPPCAFPPPAPPCLP